MQTIWLHGVGFPISDAGISAERAALSQFKSCLKSERKLFHRIQRAQDISQIRHRADAYFSSPACKYVALVRQGKDVDIAQRLPLSVYQSLSKELSLFKPIPEPSEYWDKPKSKGGTRRVFDFGPLNRAAQHMVMRAISAIFKPRSFQYSVAGRGPTRAVLAIKAKVDAGYGHVKKFDVRSFFDSFSRQGLYQILPLSPAVIDNVVMPDNLQLKPKKGAQHHGNAKHSIPLTTLPPQPSLPVLPQGSLHASILAEFAIAIMGIVMPTDAALVIFVDDILIVAKTAATLQTATHALLSAYRESPAGAFSFTTPDEDLLTGVEFVGYRLQRLPGGHLLVNPSPENLEKRRAGQKKHKTAITKASKKGFYHKGVLEKAIADFYIFQRSWVAAFRAADDFKQYVQDVQHSLVAMCRKHGVPTSKVKTLANAQFSHSCASIDYHWIVKIKVDDPLFSEL